MVVLLGAASAPRALDAAEQRSAARNALDAQPPHARDTLLMAIADTTFRDDTVRGRLLRPEGPDAPLPPGVAKLPRPGELVVSPALARQLRDPLLRDRIPGRVVGTIGDAGLVGPAELAYYGGSDTLAPRDHVMRLDRFGGAPPAPLDPLLYVLITIMVVVLLAPIGVFIAAAVRFGGEARDRRLAAVRLLGADRRMAMRIAAGESLLGALAGLMAGGGDLPRGAAAGRAGLALGPQRVRSRRPAERRAGRADRRARTGIRGARDAALAAPGRDRAARRRTPDAGGAAAAVVARSPCRSPASRCSCRSPAARTAT